MANHISPVAQLFRGMADLLDHDHTSQTQYEAITKAAAALAARAATQQLVAGPLWEADGARLLAAAYAFHAGLPRQAVTATHVRALAQTSAAPSDRDEQAPAGEPIPSSAGTAAGRPRPASSASTRTRCLAGPNAAAWPAPAPARPGRCGQAVDRPLRASARPGRPTRASSSG
jgi:hypothetical protein